MGERVIYLDYAAATPLDERVIAAMEPYIHGQYYNPSALYTPARQVREAYEIARHKLAMAIGGKPQEITITAGATESINLAIQGIVTRPDDEIVSCLTEHAAVVETAKQHAVRWAQVDERGYVKPSAVAAVITPATQLVSIGLINNELGTVQPIKEIAAVVAAKRQQRLEVGNETPLYLHTDASQAVGLLDISVSRLGVDMMTLNSGKCYGPKQVGLLWVRSGIALESILFGGGQENGLRPGSENVAGTIGFAEALSIAHAERKDESQRLHRLRGYLERELSKRLPDVVVNGHPKRHAPHILHISIPDCDGERLVYALDGLGVLAATGSACAANKGVRSHVLEAIGMDAALADSSLRLSLGRLTTDEEIMEATERIIQAAAQEKGK